MLIKCERYTTQEIWGLFWRYNRNKRCVDDAGTCQYSAGQDDHRCWYGMLLSDQEIAQHTPGQMSAGAIDSSLKIFAEPHQADLFQFIHDSTSISFSAEELGMWPDETVADELSALKRSGIDLAGILRFLIAKGYLVGADQ